GQDISVTELCRECPHLGETLAEEIALYKRFEPPDSGKGRRPEPPVREFAGLRYQPVRYHAQGGLGVVFVARDTEVGRDVALKRIQERRKHLPQDRGRFPREAQITGRLEHPGIVPVYSVGHDTSGQPYYTMRLVEGHGTQAGQAVGTPAYMSPEQARGDWVRVGPASDVFSLGATLYALLTGRAPYSGTGSLADAQVGKFAPPRQVSRAVPPALEAV